MREIKFRAWHIFSEKMYYGGELDEFNTEKSEIQHEDELYIGMKGDLFLANSDSLYERNTKEFILMQFAGLKDKNGKEIYEGDIVKTDAKTNPNSKVVFHQGVFGLVAGDSRHYPLRSFFPGGTSESVVTIDFEIIGNIYENQKL